MPTPNRRLIKEWILILLLLSHFTRHRRAALSLIDSFLFRGRLFRSGSDGSKGSIAPHENTPRHSINSRPLRLSLFASAFVFVFLLIRNTSCAGLNLVLPRLMQLSKTMIPCLASNYRFFKAYAFSKTQNQRRLCCVFKVTWVCAIKKLLYASLMSLFRQRSEAEALR